MVESARVGVTTTARQQSAAWKLLSVLTYTFNVRDTIINSLTLALVVAALIVATASGSLTLSSVFWVPFGVLLVALQCMAALLTEQEGFSLVWCALAGLVLYEEARWRAFSRAGPGSTGVALAAAAACCASLIYYAAEELCFLAAAPSNGLRGGRLAAHRCWDRLGTTMVHLSSLGIGAAAAAGADTAPERRVAFFVVLGLGACAVLSCPIVLRYSRRRCALSSVSPFAPAEASEVDLAIANLQQQLLRTRDEISRLTYERAKLGASFDASAPALDASAAPRKPAKLEDSASEGRESAEPEPEPAFEAEPSSLEQTAALDAELAVLRKRETTLVDKLAARLGHGVDASDAEQAPGSSCGMSCRAKSPSAPSATGTRSRTQWSSPGADGLTA